MPKPPPQSSSPKNEPVAPSAIPHVLPKFFPININLHTNLPEDEDKDTTGLATKIFPLTGEMMGIGGSKPFFSSEIDYSYGASFFTDLEHEDKIKVFFDRNTFRKFITECYTQKLNEINRSGYPNDAQAEYEKQKNEALEENGIAERNVLFMLNILIKVSFPKKTTVKESYSNHATTPLSVFKSPIETLRRFYSPFVYYTYLKYEGKDYTVVKARWQNDFYSHPEFYKLYSIYRSYSEWFTPEKKEEIIEKFSGDETYFTGTQLYGKEIIEYIVMVFAHDFKKYEDAENYLKNIMTFGGKTPKYADYKEKKAEIDQKLKEFNTIEERQEYLKKNNIVAIKDFEVSSSRTRYKEEISKSQVADFENFKKFVKKIYDFIKDQPDWTKFNEVTKETLSKIKENIYNKKLYCLLSNITAISNEDNDDKKSKDEIEKEGEKSKGEIEKEKCMLMLKDVRREIERRAFYVGVQKKGGVSGEFEISLYVDLFGGKIDQKNKEQYRCAFLGEKLGNEFEALWNGRYYVKSRFFFDGSEFENDENDEQGEKKQKENKEKDKEDEDQEEDNDNEDDDDDDKKSRKKKKRSSRDSEYDGGSRIKKRRNHKTLRRRSIRVRSRRRRARTFKIRRRI